ncbi:hypothetical protein OC846_003657 [Tilletia horrida]|uniref:Uncharacterized protein n=1 Tax=Tilletia horrida TaxID=155126 RepID=A0AAN6JTQ1_9BASI|nr:hypothetical protein OC845_004297 [Tilletia horrida]KAK0550460.1 hypothetical protein OC846_003657 [Tilletia horrida]KAK0564108.1 hypothetical protein OC861_004459 [Tilletia horrida]
MAGAPPVTPGGPVGPTHDVVFSHLSVRLIKTLVGDHDGAPLHHISGPMQLVTVTPPAPMLPTLVLSLPGFTLPFRTFNPTTVSGSGIHDAEPPRHTYIGFGAGNHGLDGPSLWFKEHITEEGAWDRKSRNQPAAIWTLYLMGAPTPLVTHLQGVLSGWPRNMPKLPHWLSDPALYGWPWKDQFIQMPLLLPLPLPQAQAQAQALPGVTAAPRPLPTPPIDSTPVKPNARPGIPAKPLELRSAAPAAILTPPAEESRELSNIAPIAAVVAAAVVTEQESTPAPKRRSISPSASPGSKSSSPASSDKSGRPAVQSSGRGVPRNEVGPEAAPARKKIELLPSLPPSVILPNLEHNAWAAPADEKEGPKDDESNTDEAFPAEYRHSLVAVDNETGQVLGILASNIVLDAQNWDDASSSKGEHGDDLPTPTVSRMKAAAAPKALPPKPQEEPHRPFTAYRDPDEFSPYGPSNDVDKIERPPSRLAEHTFAPPPIPRKDGLAGSARDSMASAVFFSAAEELESGAEEETDAEEHAAPGTDTDGSRPHSPLAGDGGKTAQIQLGAHPATRAVETYQEGLLRDADADAEDEGAESDRSGSTVGGFLTRPFRKKKKAKKRASSAAAAEQKRSTIVGTAMEEDADLVLNSIAPEDEGESDAVELSTESISSLSVLRGANGDVLPNHLPRTQLRTSALLDAEHQVWTDAISQNEIPATAAYTHLAAIPVSSKTATEEPESQNAQAANKGGEDSAVESSAVESPTRAAAIAAVAGEYIQGGTVLLKFLQGTISASMINPAQVADLVRQGASSVQAAVGVDSPAGAGAASSSESREDLRTGAMSYIPVLPVHLLYYMGIVTERPPASSAPDLPSAAKGALDSVARAAGVGFGVGRLWKTLVDSAMSGSYQATVATFSSLVPSSASGSSTTSSSTLESLGEAGKSGLTTCWNWVSSAAVASVHMTSDALASVGAVVHSAASPLVVSSDLDRTARARDEDEDEDDDDEWEVTIPDFDPNSLGSTPRPIYRRKVKSVVPSASNGFGVAGQSQVLRSSAGGASSGSTLKRGDVDWKRVSIVHFDGQGVSRRAVMAGAGLPGMETGIW